MLFGESIFQSECFSGLTRIIINWYFGYPVCSSLTIFECCIEKSMPDALSAFEHMSNIISAFSILEGDGSVSSSSKVIIIASESHLGGLTLNLDIIRLHLGKIFFMCVIKLRTLPSILRTWELCEFIYFHCFHNPLRYGRVVTPIVVPNLQQC